MFIVKLRSLEDRELGDLTSLLRSLHGAMELAMVRLKPTLSDEQTGVLMVAYEDVGSVLDRVAMLRVDCAREADDAPVA